MSLNNIFLPCLLLLVSGCACKYDVPRRGEDHYPGLAALKADNTEGREYSAEAYYRGSPVGVFAIHGGEIERGTARIARRVAGRDLNLYIFNGWLGPDSGRLHVTAARFDDPDAVRIATASVLGISIHAQAGPGRSICVGGKNAAAAALAAKRLREAGFSAETPCARLPGTSEANIVNRPSSGGVQLELPLGLLARLETHEAELSKFSEAVRLAALEAVKGAQAR